MFQFWQNRLLKLFFVVILTITLIFPGNTALAAKSTSIIPEQMVFVNQNVMQKPIVIALLGLSQMRVTSIKNSSTQPGQVIVVLQGTSVKKTSILSLAPGEELPLNLDTCFTTTTTVQFADAVTKLQTQQTLSALNFATVSSNTMDFKGYKVNYQVSPQTCPS
ncbi:hypothetical protein [Nostoc cycadae]|uniref:Sporulation specific penicillin-binding protein n=1 Tax=Nostoc cycadae WK-1 TaxID=1861711 RepID=A0A2H6LE20_9NOSO|nr:hypothetical protein [Nostoc cycadae]GBE91470.1 sporulation specific penicillin-binding protein [Nostoc cycadae WK-1]